MYCKNQDAFKLYITSVPTTARQLRTPSPRGRLALPHDLGRSILAGPHLPHLLNQMTGPKILEIYSLSLDTMSILMPYYILQLSTVYRTLVHWLSHLSNNTAVELTSSPKSLETVTQSLSDLIKVTKQVGDRARIWIPTLLSVLSPLTRLPEEGWNPRSQGIVRESGKQSHPTDQ